MIWKKFMYEKLKKWKIENFLNNLYVKKNFSQHNLQNKPKQELRKNVFKNDNFKTVTLMRNIAKFTCKN